MARFDSRDFAFAALVAVTVAVVAFTVWQTNKLDKTIDSLGIDITDGAVSITPDIFTDDRTSSDRESYKAELYALGLEEHCFPINCRTVTTDGSAPCLNPGCGVNHTNQYEKCDTICVMGEIRP